MRIFRISLSVLLIVPSLSLLSSCVLPPPPVPAEFEQLTVCELTDADVGSSVTVQGAFVFIHPEADGTFAEIEADGCRLGVWMDAADLDSWSAVEQDMVQEGQWVTVSGILRSHQGSLVLTLSRAPASLSVSEVPTIAQPSVSLDLPPAPPGSRLQVPVIYSGLEDITGLCYLGAFAMLVAYDHPQLDFADVIAYSGLGTNALYLDFPGVPHALTTRCSIGGIVNAAGNIESTYVLGFAAGGSGSDPGLPSGITFEDHAASVVTFSSGEQAVDTLQRVIASGRPVMVHLDFYYIHDDFASQSTYWRDVIGKVHGSHFMTVTGYDSQNIYLNDPTDPTPAAASLSTGAADFLLAWQHAPEAEGALPMGPFWMLYLEQPGQVPPAARIVAWNVDTARQAPAEIRKFAAGFEDSEMTRFLLHEMAKARQEFSNYLERNSWQPAAELYHRSALLLLEASLAAELDPASFEEIATLEENALDLLAASP